MRNPNHAACPHWPGEIQPRLPVTTTSSARLVGLKMCFLCQRIVNLLAIAMPAARAATAIEFVRKNMQSPAAETSALSGSNAGSLYRRVPAYWVTSAVPNVRAIWRIETSKCSHSRPYASRGLRLAIWYKRGSKDRKRQLARSIRRIKHIRHLVRDTAIPSYSRYGASERILSRLERKKCALLLRVLRRRWNEPQSV